MRTTPVRPMVWTTTSACAWKPNRAFASGPWPGPGASASGSCWWKPGRSCHRPAPPPCLDNGDRAKELPMPILLKRAYEAPAASDGQRVLVDRLWPRGLTKARAGIDLWLKEMAPSTALRRWYGHDPARWEAFRQRYRTELEAHPALDALRAQARQGTITLVYAARDAQHTHALVLRELLEQGD